MRLPGRSQISHTLVMGGSYALKDRTDSDELSVGLSINSLFEQKEMKLFHHSSSPMQCRHQKTPCGSYFRFTASSPG